MAREPRSRQYVGRFGSIEHLLMSLSDDDRGFLAEAVRSLTWDGVRRTPQEFNEDETAILREYADLCFDVEPALGGGYDVYTNDRS